VTRIAYISGSTIPSREANSVHVMRMCQAFGRAGHEVVLTAIEGASVDQDGDDFEAYGIEPCFTIVKHVMRSGSLFERLRYARAAAAIVHRHFTPDIYYGRHLLGLLSAARTGVPVVYEAHEFASGLVRWFERRLFRRPNLVRLVVITEALAHAYGEAYPHLASRIVVAPDAADPVDETASDDDRRRIRRPGPRLQAGYIGQLFPGKGMEMVAALAEKTPDIDFHVVGGTADDIAGWEERLEGQDNVVFHGFVPPGHTEPYRQAMDVLLAPYQRTVEGAGGSDLVQWMSPLKIFEYMASARPMIVSDLPVLREVLTDGETALLAPPDDVDAWAVALDRLQCSHQRELLGRRARHELTHHYTWSKRAGRVLEGLVT
jgi:glycosyltransferase involved in cell wall biosynthesis